MSNSGSAVDVIRVACLILAVITAAIAARAVWDGTSNRLQTYRYIGLGVLALAISTAEYHALGHKPWWPALILNIVGVVLSIMGTLPLIIKRHRRYNPPK